MNTAFYIFVLSVTAVVAAPEYKHYQHHNHPVCRPACSGGPLDECLACAPTCVKTCDNPNPEICTLSCILNGCYCKEGSVRNEKTGKCVLLKDCPKKPTEPGCTSKCKGGPHDELMTCGSACPATCKNPNPGVCTKQCIVNVCQCKKGYVRDEKSGRCVRPDQCPKPEPKCKGGPYDELMTCGTACPATCKNPNPGVCTRQCIVNVCQCTKGYVRDEKSGRCVRPDQCPKPEPKCTAKCKGGPHDRCTVCGSGCARECNQSSDIVCPAVCLENVCQCEEGYVREPKSGLCVRPEQCPKPEPKCTAKCRGGSHDQCVTCGQPCEPTCENPEVGICADVCVENTCRCEEGYVRGPHGRCILPEHCPNKYGW